MRKRRLCLGKYMNQFRNKTSSPMIATEAVSSSLTSVLSTSPFLSQEMRFKAQIHASATNSQNGLTSIDATHLY